MSNNRRELEIRLVYIFMLLVVAVPIAFQFSLPPAPLKSAKQFYDLVDNLEMEEGEVAFVAFDFGPNTKAENELQAASVLEHLFRKRIPVLLFSYYAFAEGFLSGIPERIVERLQKENPGEVWEYGKDWVNLGFRPGAAIEIQGIAKSDSLAEYFVKDSFGRELVDMPLFKGVEGFESIKLLTEFSGLSGALDMYVQFFQKEGYIPLFGHGCTAITVPDSYIFLDSGQLSGLLEGAAGAAWYTKLLNDNYPKRVSEGDFVMNTALGVAHLGIIFLVIVGNILAFVRSGKRDDA